jgi:hypothetical protein
MPQIAATSAAATIIAKRCMAALGEPQGVDFTGEWGAGAAPKARFDRFDDLARGLRPAMREQPARALGNPPAHEQDDKGKRGADQECGAPPQIARYKPRIEQHDRARRTERSADPERAVDREVGKTAHARRREFLNRRIDRRIFTADAGAGEKPKEGEAREIPREAGCSRCRQVKGERDEEQLAPA